MSGYVDKICRGGGVEYCCYLILGQKGEKVDGTDAEEDKQPGLVSGAFGERLACRRDGGGSERGGGNPVGSDGGDGCDRNAGAGDNRGDRIDHWAYIGAYD